MTFILLVTSLPSLVQAQQQGQNDAASQFNFYYAKVLPKSIDYVDDIFSLWGLRYSRNFWDDRSVFGEFGFVNADDDQVDWMSASASIRMDVPIETLVGIAFLGMDFTQYQGAGGEEESLAGFHAGGGVIAHIGGNAHFRLDMKFNSKPGTTLVFGMGFVVDL